MTFAMVCPCASPPTSVRRIIMSKVPLSISLSGGSFFSIRLFPRTSIGRNHIPLGLLWEDLWESTGKFGWTGKDGAARGKPADVNRLPTNPQDFRKIALESVTVFAVTSLYTVKATRFTARPGSHRTWWSLDHDQSIPK